MIDLVEKALNAHRIRKEANEGKELKASGVVDGEIARLHLYWGRGRWIIVAVVGEADTTEFFDNYEEAVRVFNLIKEKYGMK